MSPALALDHRVAELREAFDRGFGEAPPAPAPERQDLLAVRIAGEPYALRMSDLTGLASRRTIVPLPSRKPEVLGLAAIRGALVSVYSLRVLLGHARGATTAAWLGLCRHADGVALAFEEFEGFLRVPRAELHLDREGASNRLVREAMRIGGVSRGIVDTGSILSKLTAAGASGKTKEL